MKTYHCCASYQNTHYFDGVFTSNVDLTDEDAYDILKDQIGQEMQPPREGQGIILLSLTVIDSDDRDEAYDTLYKAVCIFFREAIALPDDFGSDEEAIEYIKQYASKTYT